MHKQTDIKKFLNQRYGIEAKSVLAVPKGVANWNYYVYLGHKQQCYLFKIYRYRNQSQISFETGILNYLANNKFPSPIVIKNKQGRLFDLYHNIPCALYQYVPGRILKKVNAKNIYQIGRGLGRLHKLLKNKPESVKRENWDPRSIKNILQKNKTLILKKDYPDKKNIISFLENELNKIKLPKLPQGLTHQDVKPENIVVDKKGKLHFIDFDNMYYGAWIIDAMTTIIWSAFRNNKLDKKLWSAFWKGYASQRKLTAVEKNNLYKVIRFRLLREAFIWIWLYSDKRAQKLCKHFLNCYTHLSIS